MSNGTRKITIERLTGIDAEYPYGQPGIKILIDGYWAGTLYDGEDSVEFLGRDIFRDYPDGAPGNDEMRTAIGSLSMEEMRMIDSMPVPDRQA